MSIPVSTKHRLLLEYNRKREKRYGDYMTKKNDTLGGTQSKLA